MRILSFITIAYFSILINGLCSSIRSPEHNLQSYAQYAILLYHDEFGKLPKNWNELRKFDKSEEYVDKILNTVKDGYKNDFIANFRFIDSATVLRIRGGQERIIAMACASMVPLRSSGLPVRVRLLIVITSDGSITTRQYPEENMAALFKQSGFNIADYTGQDGNWESEPELEIKNLEHGTEQHINKDPDPDPLPHRGHTESGHERDAGKKGTNGLSRWLTLIVSVVIVFGWLFWSKRRKSTMNPTRE